MRPKASRFRKQRSKSRPAKYKGKTIGPAGLPRKKRVTIKAPRSWVNQFIKT